MNPNSANEANSPWLPWMERAIALARKAWGQTHPNPHVGAVVLDASGQVVGEGYHPAAGQPHAEVLALREAGEAARGGTILITLEPCSTHGRTPPCVEAILSAGLKRVVVGAVDPNPVHHGRGLEILRQQGVEVISGVLAEECKDLNLIFNHQVVHQRPFVAAKVALTLDGRMATRAGHSHWITGDAARANVHLWRRYFPAILVGAGTVKADNPRLTSRQEGEIWSPRRLILDRDLRTLSLPGRQVYTDEFHPRTVLLCSEKAPPERFATARSQGLSTWSFSPQADGHLDPQAIVRRLGEEGLHGLYIEGGAAVFSRFLRAGALDYLFAYQAPLLLGDEEALAPFTGRDPAEMSGALRLTGVRHEVFGEDALTRGFLTKAG